MENKKESFKIEQNGLLSRVLQYEKLVASIFYHEFESTAIMVPISIMTSLSSNDVCLILDEMRRIELINNQKSSIEYEEVTIRTPRQLFSH